MCRLGRTERYFFFSQLRVKEEPNVALLNPFLKQSSILARTWPTQIFLHCIDWKLQTWMNAWTMLGSPCRIKQIGALRKGFKIRRLQM